MTLMLSKSLVQFYIKKQEPIFLVFWQMGRGKVMIGDTGFVQSQQ